MAEMYKDKKLSEVLPRGYSFTGEASYTRISDSEDSKIINVCLTVIKQTPSRVINGKELFTGDKYWYASPRDNYAFNLVKITEKPKPLEKNPKTTYFLDSGDFYSFIKEKAFEFFPKGSSVKDKSGEAFTTIEHLKIEDGIIINQDRFMIWRPSLGFMVEAVKEEIPKYVVIDKMHLGCGEKGKFLEVQGVEGDTYMARSTQPGDSFVILKKYCRIATKAEIKAHGLGFHIGDEVWLSTESLEEERRKHIYPVADKSFGKILKFEFDGKEIMFRTDKPESLAGSPYRLAYFTNKQKGLNLGGGKVALVKSEISGRIGKAYVIPVWQVFYKSESVSFESLLTWAEWFIPAAKKSASVSGKLDNYVTLTRHSEGKVKYIKIGCEDYATIEQIEAIVEACKETLKKEGV